MVKTDDLQCNRIVQTCPLINLLQQMQQPFPTQQILQNKQNLPSTSRRYLDQILCPICLEVTPQAIAFGSCQHHFCLQCTMAHCKNKLTQFQPVNCPIDSCPVRITKESAVYGRLSAQERNKIQKYQQFVFVSSNPEYKACRKEECLGKFKPNKQQCIKCDQCLVQHCGSCHEIKHTGKCTNNLADMLKNRQLYMQCGRCKNMVQRNGGCIHITCRCGFQFCYYCGQEFGSGHSCKGKGNRMQQIIWNINERNHFFECSCLSLRSIFTFFRFSRADSTPQKIFKWILFMLVVYPLGIVFLLSVILTVCLIGLLMLFVIPFVLLNANQSLQGRIRDKTNFLVALILVLVLYPLFYLFSIIYLLYRWSKQSHSSQSITHVFSALGVFLIMPCLIINY